MKIFLKVPFTEKDEAKKLGARWNSEKKLWYIENIDDISPFKKWMSDKVQQFDDAANAPEPSGPKISAGIIQKGSK